MESFVKLDWVKKVDFNQAESLNTTFISDEYKLRGADVIYKLKFQKQEIYLKGLGLHYSKMMVELHGATVYYRKSECGESEVLILLDAP